MTNSADGRAKEIIGTADTRTWNDMPDKCADSGA
jgi:hypothetical protein